MFCIFILISFNCRYDEWIKADKIVRPADKNVPKIKHRKKIKVSAYFAIHHSSYIKNFYSQMMHLVCVHLVLVELEILS